MFPTIALSNPTKFCIKFSHAALEKALKLWKLVLPSRNETKTKGSSAQLGLKKLINLSFMSDLLPFFYVELLIVSLPHCSIQLSSVQLPQIFRKAVCSSINDQKRDIVPNMTRDQLLRQGIHEKRFLFEIYYIIFVLRSFVRCLFSICLKQFLCRDSKQIYEFIYGLRRCILNVLDLNLQRSYIHSFIHLHTKGEEFFSSKPEGKTSES